MFLSGLSFFSRVERLTRKRSRFPFLPEIFAAVAKNLRGKSERALERSQFGARS